MQQYQVPLFIDEAPPIFGPLNLLQFMIVGVAGAVVLIILMFTNNVVLTAIAGVILGGPAFYLALGRINGEIVPKILRLAVKFRLSKKMSLWSKEGKEGVSLKEIQRTIESRRKLIETTKESRLKKISWEIETGKK
ncbi:MAG: hypothetical protein O2U61_02650 [Candidatus Bathyarchaeota archaeon]|nr:hypothetical protein [Candidatus Bathyarchaeota archaeon]